jgi:hypothetical protein
MSGLVSLESRAICLSPWHQGEGGNGGSAPLSLRRTAQHKEQPYYAHYYELSLPLQYHYSTATVPLQYHCQYTASTTASTALAGIEPSNLTTTAPAQLSARYPAPTAPVPRPLDLHATHLETRIEEGTGKGPGQGEEEDL